MNRIAITLLLMTLALTRFASGAGAQDSDKGLSDLRDTMDGYDHAVL